MFFLVLFFFSFLIYAEPTPKGKFSYSFYIPIFHGGGVRGLDLTLKVAKFPHCHARRSPEMGGSRSVLIQGIFHMSPFKKHDALLGSLLKTPMHSTRAIKGRTKTNQVQME